MAAAAARARSVQPSRQREPLPPSQGLGQRVRRNCLMTAYDEPGWPATTCQRRPCARPGSPTSGPPRCREGYNEGSLALLGNHRADPGHSRT